MGFLIYVDNGPKMSFEEDPMSIDTELNGAFLFDEYELLHQMCEELARYPDKSINIKLLISFFDMLDFKDVLSIKKSIGVQIPRESLPDEFKYEYIEDIEIVRSVSKIRAFKEKIFPYGAWEVTCALILGNADEKIKLDEVMKSMNSVRRDWSRVANFKSGQKSLQTASELRTLDVYNIGGLEFTDIYEVMFLYLERNFIAP